MAAYWAMLLPGTLFAVGPRVRSANRLQPLPPRPGLLEVQTARLPSAGTKTGLNGIQNGRGVILLDYWLPGSSRPVTVANQRPREHG